MITLSRDGFIKRIPYKNYIRSNSEPSEIEYREGDELKYLVKSNTKDNLFMFTDKGNMYQIKGINIPEGKWKEKGERIDTLIKALNLNDENIIGVESVDNLDPNKFVTIVTNRGSIKETSLDNFATNYSKLQATKLRDGEVVIKAEIKKEEKDFLKVETKLGLVFTMEKPKLENLPRNILGKQLFNLSNKDEVVSVEYVETMNFVEFTVGVTSKGTLKAFAKAKNNDVLKTNTDSLSELLMFTNRGNVIKIKSFLIEEKISEEEIKIDNLVDGLEKNEKVIAIYSMKEYKEGLALYTVTKNGFVKKTILSEFKGDFLIQQAYKFKASEDEVICADISSVNIGFMVMITKKGMAIRFPVNNVNPMGKVASGVTGMSIKDDEVFFAKCFVNMEQKENGEIAITSLDKYQLQVSTKNKEITKICVNTIKLQNRAGRGSSLITVQIDDEIKNINLI